ncbi:MAG: hypothetical protein ACYDCH_13695 [Gaiellaceae bacterium]
MARTMSEQRIARAALRNEWPFVGPYWEDSSGAPPAGQADLVRGLVATAGGLDLQQCPSCGIWCTASSSGCPQHRSTQRTSHRRGGLVGLGRGDD